MKSGFKFRLEIASAGIAAALTLGGCATTTAERYVAPPIGSTWSNVRSDTGSYGSARVLLTGKMGEQKYNAFENEELTLLARANGDWVTQVRGSTPLITWDPPVGWEWPLEVGKTWTKKSSITIHAAKQTIPFEYTNKVESYENVSVAAGTFGAFKISSFDTLGNENIAWFAPDLGITVKSILKRTAKHSQGAGTREIELLSQKIAR
jgi:hypothetical protein